MEDQKRRIIVLGGGGHAKTLLSILSRNDNYSISGFLDDDTTKETILGFPRLGPLLPAKPFEQGTYAVIGLGHIGNTKVRERIINDYETSGIQFERVIAHTSFSESDVQIGKGTVISHGAILQTSVVVGDYSIINTNSSVDHDCKIGNHVHIAPGVTLSGCVTIGDRTLIGTGAKIIQGITVAPDCIIGAGAVVVSDCTEVGGVYVSNPAKLIKYK
jgi:UDP-perosamine 4-acetyltransferase